MYIRSSFINVDYYSPQTTNITTEREGMNAAISRLYFLPIKLFLQTYGLGLVCHVDNSFHITDKQNVINVGMRSGYPFGLENEESYSRLPSKPSSRTETPTGKIPRAIKYVFRLDKT